MPSTFISTSDTEQYIRARGIAASWPLTKAIQQQQHPYSSQFPVQYLKLFTNSSATLGDCNPTGLRVRDVSE